MSKMSYYWICDECESKASHKGLCRECSTYDSAGKVVNPIRRTKMNRDGTPHIRQTNRPIIPSHERDGFRRRKKPTKKQMAEMEKTMARFRPPNDGVVSLLGESDEEE